MPRASSTPAWYTSTLKPGGSLIFLIGSLSAAVAIGYAGTGAKLRAASFFGLPCAQGSFSVLAASCFCASAAEIANTASATATGNTPFFMDHLLRELVEKAYSGASLSKKDFTSLTSTSG